MKGKRTMHICHSNEVSTAWPLIFEVIQNCFILHKHYKYITHIGVRYPWNIASELHIYTHFLLHILSLYIQISTSGINGTSVPQSLSEMLSQMTRGFCRSIPERCVSFQRVGLLTGDCSIYGVTGSTGVLVVFVVGGFGDGGYWALGSGF
jgi:hypothetical protein